jgi:hypothetical protein
VNVSNPNQPQDYGVKISRLPESDEASTTYGDHWLRLSVNKKAHTAELTLTGEHQPRYGQVNIRFDLTGDGIVVDLNPLDYMP